MSAFSRASSAASLPIAWKDGGTIGVALGFYLIVVTLLPLGLGPDLNLLSRIAPGLLWVALLLSALLSLGRLFETDLEDGSLEVLATGPLPLEAVAAAKSLAHWLTTGVPLTASGAAAWASSQPAARGLWRAGGDHAGRHAGHQLRSARVGAALTLRTRRGGLLLALLMLPLFVPTLDLRHRGGQRCASQFRSLRAVLPDPRRHLAGGPGAGARWRPARRCDSSFSRDAAAAFALAPAEGLDHCHADADPKARQPDAFHGAFGAAAALGRCGAAGVLIAVGLYLALFVAPPDYQQGQAAKIMYVHVPSAWLAMFGYVLVAASSFGLLVFRHPLADVSAKAAAPIGAVFTGLCLAHRLLWGKPMWGAFWVWDPRLTSVLILFFLYLGLIALRSSIEDEALAAKLTAVLALVGIVILPVIKFSVDWNSLHQPASVMRLGAPAIHPSLLWPLLVMAFGMTLLFVALHLKAMRNEILRRRVKALRIVRADASAALAQHVAS